MEIMQGVLDFWNFVIKQVFALLTMDLKQFSPTVYGLMDAVNGGLQAIAYAMLVIFTFMEILRTSANFKEVARPEFILKVFVRFILTKYLIGYSFRLTEDIFTIIRGVIGRIFSSSGLVSINGNWAELKVPSELTDGVGNFLTDAFNLITKNLFNLLPMILMILAFIIILVLTLSLLLTVLGRFFNLYLFIALSPIPLSTFGCRETSQFGKNYLKSFAGACLHGAVIGIAIVVFSAYMQSPMFAFSIDDTTSIWYIIFAWAGGQGARLAYCFNLIFNMFIFMGTIRAADRLVNKLFGV